MAVYLSPVGLSTAQVPNRVSLLAIYKERLCRRVCDNSTNQPESFVTYKTGTPVFNGTTVFVPVIATVTIVTPGCGCKATTQVITEMVVDVTIEANGKMATYAIPENHSVTYAGHLVLSTEKSGLMSEVEAQKANAEQVLASASKAQNVIDKAPSLLAELNPMYKEKQETEQRFGKIEKSISGMEELMKKQQEMIEKFIKKFES